MKKPTAIQISIPEPCTQAWDAMQPVQGGRHCAHCQKVVVDFTRMTDAQLLAYFRKNEIGCGKFRSEQINVSIKVFPVAKKHWLARIAATMLFIVGLSKMAEAQVKKGHPQIVQTKTPKTKIPTKQLKEITVKPKGYQEPISETIGQISYRQKPEDQYKKLSVAVNEYPLKRSAQGAKSLARTSSIHRSFWKRLQFWRK